MHVTESKQFSQDYHAPDKRSIANSMKLVFQDGSESDWVTIEYPIGHHRRRSEGWPILMDKFKKNISTQLSPLRIERIMKVMSDTNALSTLSVDDFMALWSDVC